MSQYQNTSNTDIVAKLIKLISGGQTGADRAALDVAISLGLDYGGALPKGRLTEEGPLDLKYDRMTEMKSGGYAARTEKNVKDSDGTIIFTVGKLTRGSALTVRKCKKHGKPYLHINLEQWPKEKTIEVVQKWIDRNKPQVINIAGSRESKTPGIYENVFQILSDSFQSRVG